MNLVKKGLFIVLFIFIMIGSIQFLMNTNTANDPMEIDEATAQITPEQMKLQTMTAISDIVLTQFLENVILNIDLNTVDDKQNVILHLQANEFLSEETLLKDSYNILKDIQYVDSVGDFTFKWHMLVKNTNTEVLTLSFDQKTITSIEDYTYRDLTKITKVYEKHERLK